MNRPTVPAAIDAALLNELIRRKAEGADGPFQTDCQVAGWLVSVSGPRPGDDDADEDDPWADTGNPFWEFFIRSPDPEEPADELAARRNGVTP